MAVRLAHARSFDSQLTRKSLPRMHNKAPWTGVSRQLSLVFPALTIRLARGKTQLPWHTFPPFSFLLEWTSVFPSRNAVSAGKGQTEFATIRQVDYSVRPATMDSIRLGKSRPSNRTMRKCWRNEHFPPGAHEHTRTGTLDKRKQSAFHFCVR